MNSLSKATPPKQQRHKLGTKNSNAGDDRNISFKPQIGYSHTSSVPDVQMAHLAWQGWPCS